MKGINEKELKAAAKEEFSSKKVENTQKKEERDTLLASEEDAEDIEIELPESYGKEEVERIKAFAKSLKLTKEQALGLSKLSKELEKNSLQKQEEQMKEWEDELKNDSEFGKKNFAKNLEYAKIALQKFDTNNELRALLNESSYGSHPIVVKFFMNLGKKLNEDNFVQGENAKKNKPLYERLYN